MQCLMPGKNFFAAQYAFYLMNTSLTIVIYSEEGPTCQEKCDSNLVLRSKPAAECTAVNNLNHGVTTQTQTCSLTLVLTSASRLAACVVATGDMTCCENFIQ